MVSRRLLHGPSSLSHIWLLSSFSWTQFGVQQRFINLPRIVPKLDPYLESVMGKERYYRPVMKLKELILEGGVGGVPFALLQTKRSEIRLPPRIEQVKSFARGYPNIFEVFIPPDSRRYHCRLAPDAAALVEEERRTYYEAGGIESEVVEKLRKLLMMSPERSIRADKIEYGCRDFGIPRDFLTNLVPRYPEHFRVLPPAELPVATLELVAWDDHLGLSAFERRVKNLALAKGLGELDPHGYSLAFKSSYPPGMSLKARIRQHFQTFQELPYISPYRDYTGVEPGSLQHDKRNIAVLHELLSLTIEKKTLVQILCNFRTDYRLPQNFRRAFERYPGIFYISEKGAIHNVFLREGYEKSELVERHPLVDLKEKFLKLMAEGAKIRAASLKTRNELKEERGLDSCAV